MSIDRITEKIFFGGLVMFGIIELLIVLIKQKIILKYKVLLFHQKRIAFTQVTL